ncbi:MAG TPA: hypothetical protein VFY93_12875 [Planctomycetota bacterium]|nr:hypothetical protein [Planctomycetota bacterium]
MVPLLLALLLAPDATHELKLHFEKGMVYEDATKGRIKLRLIEQNRVAKFDVEEDCLLRRTVVSVGDDGLPSEEKIEVVRFAKTVHEQPMGDAGAKANPAEGKTFLWKRAGDGYALLEGDKDVTKEHSRLAERLMSYRAKRLPDKPVAVGETWEVPASEFLAATGQVVPPGLEGKAVFKLEEVKDGVARVAFELKTGYRERDREITGVQKGTWLLDIAHGREVSLEATGEIAFEQLKAGDGSLRMTRTLTYR